jgi:hypothetical protein
MRSPWLSLLVTAPLLAIVLVAPLSVLAVPVTDFELAEASKRDNDHMHMHHGAPLTELNETAIIQWHAPTPPSYWSIDIEDRDPSLSRYPGLMAFHVIFISLAFFVALPVGK